MIPVMTICGRTDSCDDPRDEMGCEDWLWCHLIRAVERPRHGGTEAVNLWEGGLLPGAWIVCGNPESKESSLLGQYRSLQSTNLM